MSDPKFVGDCLGISARGVDELRRELRGVRDIFGLRETAFRGWLAWNVLTDMSLGKIALVENTPRNDVTKFIFDCVSRFDPETHLPLLPDQYMASLRLLQAFRYSFDKWRKR